jgi:hypothetical protein
MIKYVKFSTILTAVGIKPEACSPAEAVHSLDFSNINIQMSVFYRH